MKGENLAQILLLKLSAPSHCRKISQNAALSLREVRAAATFWILISESRNHSTQLARKSFLKRPVDVIGRAMRRERNEYGLEVSSSSVSSPALLERIQTSEEHE